MKLLLYQKSHNSCLNLTRLVSSVIVLLLVSVVMLSSIRIVNSQNISYVQPFMDAGWDIRVHPTLVVEIPAAPISARTVIRQALEDWNKAQEWFLESYYPNDTNRIYQLATNTSANSDAQIIIGYVDNLAYSWGAYTRNYRGASGFTERSSISIRNDQLFYTNALLGLVTHELGHSLGLDHNGLNDLMNPKPVNIYPSTLNLYAVYMLTFGQSVTSSFVYLPNSIRYEMWFPNNLPLPEFPSELMILISFTAMVFFGRSSKRVRRPN